MTAFAGQSEAAADSGRAVAPADADRRVVACDDLGKRIDGRSILTRIGLEVEPGDAVSLLGANGAGKSTLLRILATLIPATSGGLRLFGRPAREDAPALRRRIGMIAHQLMLYRELSVRENLMFYGRLYGVADPAARAMELLEFVGLADRADDTVKALSRGMAQRVAIARALMHAPDLLLADEPFTGLDTRSSDLLEQRLDDLRAEGRTIVLTTHDIRQGLRIAERVVVLKKGRVSLDAGVGAVDLTTVVDAM